MKVVTPLDYRSLLRIPIALEGRFYLGGPYELKELLQEPEQYGDEDIDWRDIEIIDNTGKRTGSARIEVASGFCRMNACVWPGQPSRVTQKLRYLYRTETNSGIEGAVTVEALYVLPGVSKQFAVEIEAVIHSVYVAAASRCRGIARVLLAEVLNDAPHAKVHPQFSDEGARLFGFDKSGKRAKYEVNEEDQKI